MNALVYTFVYSIIINYINQDKDLDFFSLQKNLTFLKFFSKLYNIEKKRNAPKVSSFFYSVFRSIKNVWSGNCKSNKLFKSYKA